MGVQKLNSVTSISSASVERSFSCLKRVKAYLRNKMGQDHHGSLCRIALHRHVLKEVENKNILHDNIVQRFLEKPRTLNFLFKKLHVTLVWLHASSSKWCTAAKIETRK